MSPSIEPAPSHFSLRQLFGWVAVVGVVFGAIQLAIAVPSTAVPLPVIGIALGLAWFGIGSIKVVFWSAVAMGMLGLGIMAAAYQTQEFPVIDFYDNWIAAPLLFAAAGGLVGQAAIAVLTLRDVVVRWFNGEGGDG